MRHSPSHAVRAIRIILALCCAPLAAAAQEITLWSHWAAEQSKRNLVERAIQRFQATHPKPTIKATWYEQNALYAALRTALRAGRGPDVFYAEPDQVEYMQNNLLLDLSTEITWDRVEPSPKQVWTYSGKPYGLPLGAWTAELCINPPDQGGQAPDFPLGVMRLPGPDGAACAECRTIAVGGSYVVSAGTRQPELARAFLDAFTTPEMGVLWLQEVMLQTGIKTDPTGVCGKNAPYFRQLAASDAGAQFRFGIPLQATKGGLREAFTQVINSALITGNIGVEDAVQQMTAVHRAQ